MPLLRPFHLSAARRRDFASTHASEMTVWAHENRSEVGEQAIIAFGRQVNAPNPLRIRKGFFISRALQPDPAAIFKKAVECRPRAVLQHEIHVRKTLPAYAVPMLPARIRREERHGISNAEAGTFSSELAVDLGYMQEIFKSASHRKRGGIEIAE